MRIIIEEYQYPAEKVDKVLWAGAFQTVDGKVSIGYVGYYWNNELKDSVFFLPKVLLDENDKVFGKYAPEDIIDLDKSQLTKEERDFIYGFAVWIYRALVVFKEANPNSKIVLHEFVAQAGRGRRRLSNTFLDVILALIEFEKRNRDFVTFVAKTRHSGFNKINWTKTVAKKTPIFADGATPVYAEVVNRKKEVDRDEELFIIFHSILNYIRETYGFEVKPSLNYELIKGKKFGRYLSGYGRARLRQIKYKYFSDKLLALWELCYVFFDNSHRVSLSAERKEYLLAKDFNIVFESMIDELVGERRDSLPDGLKDQDDGKIVDHMFSYQGLTNNDEEEKKVYYIGDSKYYKRSSRVGGESIAKQFTYARNVIQWNLDLFLNDKPSEAAARKKFPKLRDDVTEGYNIVPNFFISARINKLSYEEGEIKRRDEVRNSRHFENRLYDRDTLLIAHYDVNFLFIVSLYARNSAATKGVWREKMRGKFRCDIQAMLQERYKFYAMTPLSMTDAEAFFKEHFQLLLGKVFTPYNDTHPQTTFYSVALAEPHGNDQIEAENEEVLECLKEAFEVAECPLGIDPSSKVSVHPPMQPAIVPSDLRPRHFVEAYSRETFLFGCIKNDGGIHEDWIFSRNKFKRDDMYNVRFGSRPGAVKLSNPGVKSPKFAVLYMESDAKEFRVFRIRGVGSLKRQATMKKLEYPHPSGSYFCYTLDEEVNLSLPEDIVKSVKTKFRHLLKDPVNHPFKPIYITGTQLQAAMN